MRNQIFTSILCLIACVSTAQSEGPLNGNGFLTIPIAGFDKSWLNPENATPSDDVYSDFGNLSNPVGQYTDYLVANKFGFNIPTNVIITGIVVEIERSDPQQNTADYSIKILKGGNPSGDEKSTGENYPAIDTYKPFGGSNDLWGETWTPADINDDGFGIAIAAQRSVGGPGVTGGQIDNIRIIVYYTNLSTLPVNLLDFHLRKNTRSLELSWTTSQETDMSGYEVERSSDGRNFLTLQTVPALNRPVMTSYSATDMAPMNGVSYYRIKMAERDGSATYSRIISVDFNQHGSLVLFPNPLRRGTNLQISNPNGELRMIQISNSSGQLIGSMMTNLSSIPSEQFTMNRGIVFYKIFDGDSRLMGSGSLLVY